MFDSYFYAKHGEDFIVYETKSADKSLIMNLYYNESLVDSKEGLFGDFVLTAGTVVLKIKNSAMKSVTELTVDGQIVKLEKVKLKVLRQELSQANIFNKLNPTQAAIEAGKFDFNRLLIPLSLLVVGLILQFFVQGASKSVALASLIPAAIAGWMLFEQAAERSSIVRAARRGRIAFVLAFAFVIGFLGETLFKLF